MGLVDFLTMSGPEATALAYLFRIRGGSTYPTDLIENGGLSPASAVVALAKLQERGFLSMEPTSVEVPHRGSTRTITRHVYTLTDSGRRYIDLIDRYVFHSLVAKED